jgi:predicted amidohydrolase
VAAIQAKQRTISYKVDTAEEAMKQVRDGLDELTVLAERAAERGCHIIAFPEDTLGTLEWESGHWDEVAELLRPAEQEMLTRFGEVAARHGMHIICCNDCVEDDLVYNTAILLGRNGQEIGRYRKVQPPLAEQARARGRDFPVFEAPGIGTVGLCICYDMMFPETTRALALAGADIVFHLTMGGASLASSDASLAAFKTRAADNYIYLVVAFRSGGSMIISPKGEILAEGAQEPDAIVTADIDPTGGREAGDAFGGITVDFRARLFRERVPGAYGILMEEHPPILEKLQDIPVPSPEEAAALFAEGLTTGADAFDEADRWLSEGKVKEAKRRFEELAEHFGTAWIGRASRDRLKKIAEEEKMACALASSHITYINPEVP